MHTTKALAPGIFGLLKKVILRRPDISALFRSQPSGVCLPSDDNGPWDSGLCPLPGHMIVGRVIGGSRRMRTTRMAFCKGESNRYASQSATSWDTLISILSTTVALCAKYACRLASGSILVSRAIAHETESLLTTSDRGRQLRRQISMATRAYTRGFSKHVHT